MSVAERALVVTWVMNEARQAVENSYEIIEIYEMYGYDVYNTDLASHERIGAYVTAGA